MTSDRRPSRARAMPPAAVDSRATPAEAGWGEREAELQARLARALAGLPEAERTAVVASYGYAGGPVGAAVELDLDVEDADAVARNALQLLRAALADLDAHGTPL